MFYGFCRVGCGVDIPMRSFQMVLGTNPVHTHIHMHIYIYIKIHIYISICICLYICICIIYIYMYMCTHKSRVVDSA